ncbi:hypothetical protein HD554DRAFT_983157 [Boletus coccyginus]|nr:hypothetical protein HD554DRAFT_983157 [Boletus coccyginus]
MRLGEICSFRLVFVAVPRFGFVASSCNPALGGVCKSSYLFVGLLHQHFFVSGAQLCSHSHPKLSGTPAYHKAVPGKRWDLASSVLGRTSKKSATSGTTFSAESGGSRKSCTDLRSQYYNDPGHRPRPVGWVHCDSH